MHTTGLFTFLILTATLAAACGPANPQEQPDTGDAGSDAGADSRARDDAGTSGDSSPATETGSSLDSGPAGCDPKGADDLPDDDGRDTNCDGVDGRADKDIYVNPVGGSDTNAGTPTAPFGSIGKAIAIAATRIDANIFLAAGSYALDELKVSGKVRIYGGYSSKFVGAPSRERTSIEVGPDGLMVVGTGGDAKLVHLTIAGNSPKTADQPSAYGLRTKIDTLVLDDVVVRAGDGYAGVDGDAGLAGSPGLKGCNADQLSSTSTPCGGVSVCDGVKMPTYTNGAGPGTANAEGKRPGTTVATMWCSSPPCAPELASAGVGGADGKDAPKVPTLVDGFLRWGAPTDGGSNGTAGYGGAGPAGYSWVYSGFGGSGGCPGKGGTAGTSGGGAIAVVVLAGELTVTRSALMTGYGGHGGSGGEGGLGGDGGAGGWPQGATTSCDPKATPPPADKCATHGGSGGAGGRGGHGGGGAGGWTIGVLTAKAAKASVDTATTFALGKVGVGGSGNGGGYAPSGEKKTTYAMP